MFSKALVRSWLALALLALNPLGLLGTNLTPFSHSPILVSPAAAAQGLSATEQANLQKMRRELSGKSQKVLAKFQEALEKAPKKLQERIKQLTDQNPELATKIQEHYKTWNQKFSEVANDLHYAMSMQTMPVLFQLEQTGGTFDDQLFIQEGSKLLEDLDWYFFRKELSQKEPELAKSTKLDLGYVFDTAKKSVPDSSPGMLIGTFLSNTLLANLKLDKKSHNVATKVLQYIAHKEFSNNPLRFNTAQNDLERIPVTMGMLMLLVRAL